MSIGSVMAISLSGMQAQTQKLSATASNVANALTPGYNRLETQFNTTASGGVSASTFPSGQPSLPESSNVDIASEMLSLIQAELAFKANASAWESGADMWDVLKTIVRD
ncbi:flagellar basal body protein [Peteryoungia ipomoeae]|uniref:Flagellar basal body rod protein n=1 Tax=Peteryoungia ipomoeae TaxID=1210932 RepID=A0A4S8PB55_9HYPH|nr:flagellar basal body protein [Peteryoungia ipomoeae]THV25354.1 flagellar basal body rod protein [Peteryoungia ipomoeae]